MNFAARGSDFALMFLSVIAAAKPPVPVPAVEWSNYDPSFVIESVDGQAMSISFKGKIEVTGVLFVFLGHSADYHQTHFVPDAAYHKRLPQVVGGFKPIPLKSIELSPAAEIVKAAFSAEEISSAAQNRVRVVKKPVRIVLRNFSTFVECDWRYYTATVRAADVVPLTLSAGLAPAPAGGC